MLIKIKKRKRQYFDELISFTKSCIWFNSAVMRNVMGSYVEVYYDRDRRELAFKFLEKKHSDSFSLTKDKKAGKIASSSIYKVIGHDRNRVVHYRPYRTNGFIVVDLNHPSF